MYIWIDVSCFIAIGCNDIDIQMHDCRNDYVI